MREHAVPKPAEASHRSVVSRHDDRSERDADRAADELTRVADHGAARPDALGATAREILGYNFGSLRIHRDEDAARAAGGLRARAFTVGSDIVFGAGEFAPETPRGRWLLFHELAHVRQQLLGTAGAVVQRSPIDTGRVHGELEAQYAREHGGVAPRGGAHGEEYEGWLIQPSYDAAVALLQAKDPTLYGYLSQGRVGQNVVVRRLTMPVTGGGPGQPTSVEFRFVLKVIHGIERGGAAAEFERVHETVDLRPPTSSVTLPMPMHFRSRSGPNATAELSEALYHEGVHMLLAMDRLIERYVPGSTRIQSGKLASFQAMLGRIRNQRSFLTLSVDLQSIIGGMLIRAGMPANQATRAADQAATRVIEGVLEERFAIDEQRRQYPGRPVQTVTNYVIAREYLPNELLNESIVLQDQNDVTRLIQETTAVLDLVPPP